LIKIALVGQPNCGKSTIFNQVAGYKSITSNFPGKTVTYNATKININGNTIELIDLPGTYSLSSSEPSELETRKYLISNEADIVINVVDSSVLIRSLELTLQLLELQVPMILCLNMLDEAKRKGMVINSKKLSDIFGIKICNSIASKGIGIKELFRTSVKEALKKAEKPKIIPFSRDIEKIIDSLILKLAKEQQKGKSTFPQRLNAIKFLENDETFLKETRIDSPHLIKEIEVHQKKLEKSHGKASDQVISSERHSLAMNIFEETVEVKHGKRTTLRDKFDNILLHKYFGYLFLIIILGGFFYIIFKPGAYIEQPLMNQFQRVIIYFEGKGLFFKIIESSIQGIAGGVAIVLPYLFPFLFGLALLEDIGYLPRMAFLLDAFMHKIGLHGKSAFPFILSYGCTVPGIMSTRILESERERFITILLATMIPCSARITIIFGLVAYFISPWAALFIYLFNLLIIAITGKVFTKILPDISPGLIMEIPSYKTPSLKVVFAKTWLRMKDFIIVAWPILIAGSVVLSLLKYYNLESNVNMIFSPITKSLGLPVIVGTTLIFGILRKELSMIMLLQVFNTPDISSVMSASQIFIFTIFVVFYVPCLATITVIFKELGLKRTIISIMVTLFIAYFVSLAFRLFFALF